jgi:hypothetical protein
LAASGGTLGSSAISFDPYRKASRLGQQGVEFLHIAYNHVNRKPNWQATTRNGYLHSLTHNRLMGNDAMTSLSRSKVRPWGVYCRFAGTKDRAEKRIGHICR